MLKIIPINLQELPKKAPYRMAYPRTLLCLRPLTGHISIDDQLQYPKDRVSNHSPCHLYNQEILEEDKYS